MGQGPDREGAGIAPRNLGRTNRDRRVPLTEGIKRDRLSREGLAIECRICSDVRNGLDGHWPNLEFLSLPGPDRFDEVISQGHAAGGS